MIPTETAEIVQIFKDRGFKATPQRIALDACGLIIPVTIDSGRIHYDADTRFHGHFRCEKCGRIYDFVPDLIGIQGLDGFTVHHKDVYFSGICSCCQ